MFTPVNNLEQMEQVVRFHVVRTVPHSVYCSLTWCCSDTLLNVFLAIAVDNLATAQALTRDEEREQKEREIAKRKRQEKRRNGWLKAKKQLPIVLNFKNLSNLRNRR